MKKYFILGCFCFLHFVSFAQVNNHWQLGKLDLDFSNGTLNTVYNNGSTTKNLATASDVNGDLLFYTDGHRVWDKNHDVLISGLSYFDSSWPGFIYYDRQQVIIIPIPGDENRFVIVRNVATYWSGPFQALYYCYSIIDFNSNPLGEVEVINPNQEDEESIYTRRLKTQNGGSFALNANEKYAPLTFAFDSENEAYWVILQNQNQNYFYSYKVDNQGINENAVESSFAQNQIYKFTTSFDPDHDLFGMIKMSPDNTKLVGLEYYIDSDYVHQKSGFYTLDFDLATGQFTNYNLIQYYGPNVLVDMEFSSNGNLLYFTQRKYEGIPTQTVNEGEVLVKDLTNLTLPLRRLYETGTTDYTSDLTFLQRDQNGELLISSLSSTNDRNLYLHKVANQNSYSSSSVTYEAHYLEGETLQYLPQLIPPVFYECSSDLTITSTVTNGNTDIQTAGNTITATNIIENGAIASYDAGDSVTLSPGFVATFGSDFEAFIGGCTSSRPLPTKVSYDKKGGEQVILNGGLEIYPNPTANYLMLSSELNMQSYTITNRMGIAVIQGRFTNDETNFNKIDLSKLSQDVYILTVYFENGTIESKKIMKK